MSKVVGVLKNASVPALTKSGEKSEARAVDPQDTQVEVDGSKNPVDVKGAVLRYCKALKAKKDAENEAAVAADALRAYVGELRKENAEQGDYQKTYRVVGERRDKKVYAADVTQSDRWNMRKKVKPADVLKEHGKVVFDKVVLTDESIQIRGDVMSNRAKRRELSKKLEEALGIDGIREFFEKVTMYRVRDGMDRDQYTLDASEWAVIDALFTQSADSVKDATQAAE